MNIFIRKETAFSLFEGRADLYTTFANVINYDNENNTIHYEVDFIEPSENKTPRWHYSSRESESGTYILPVERFMQRFEPDTDKVYLRFQSQD